VRLVSFYSAYRNKFVGLSSPSFDSWTVIVRLFLSDITSNVDSFYLLTQMININNNSLHEYIRVSETCQN
jgi:hypothetical protein